MTKPKPKPRSAFEAVHTAIDAEEAKRPLELKPIEVVKVALAAYQSFNYAPVAQPGLLAQSKDRESLRRGTQAAMDRLLFNVNYWRSSYEDRIVAACASAEDAAALLEAISAWTSHTMKLNTLNDAQVHDLFARFCPPLVENNRRGSKQEGKGKGPVADFVLQAKQVAPHLSPEKRSALESIVSDVEDEAKTYARFRDGETLDAYYELLPVWCLQDRIDLVAGNWWNDADVVLCIAARMRKLFERDGHPQAYCTYFYDMVAESLDGYLKEIDDAPRNLREMSVPSLLEMLGEARRAHPDSETEGYGPSFPSWLSYKEQLVWNIVVCAVFGPQHARPFMTDPHQGPFIETTGPGVDVITSMAKNSYDRYLALRRKSQVNAEFDSFEQLPDDLHASSIERIVSFPDMLKTLGFRIVPAASCYPDQRVEVFAPSEVEVLAILEHRRWCEERKAAGWTYSEIKDAAKRNSPYLTEWENLPERAREWNRSSARDIPILLAAEGLAISR